MNEEVRKGGDAGLDERCLDLQSAKGEKRCEFLPGKEEGGIEGERGRGFGERVLVSSSSRFPLFARSSWLTSDSSI